MTQANAVARLEALLGQTLPADNRNWLLDPNASYPVPAEISIPDSSPWIDSVDCLYAAQEVLEMMESERELNASGCRDFPRLTVPIGQNELGDHFLISLREKDSGTVYFLFHETADPEEDDHAGLFILAARFDEWIAALTPQSEDDDEA